MWNTGAAHQPKKSWDLLAAREQLSCHTNHKQQQTIYWSHNNNQGA